MKNLVNVLLFLCFLPMTVLSQQSVNIVVDPNSSTNILGAVQEMTTILKKIQPTLRIQRSQSTSNDNVNIVIKTGDSFAKSNLSDSDGFVIKKIDNRTVLISGISEIGTEFGIYGYLEDVIGVCWLMPSDLWLDLPAKISTFFPSSVKIEQPFFLTRELSPLDPGKKGSKMGEWARRNKLRRRVEFHHNMNTLFQNSKNVDFIASYKGQQAMPNFSSNGNWQPNFSAKGITEYASKEIITFFRKNPTASSYSLGINDSYRFDTRIVGLSKTKAGLTNFSDSYYKWVNNVVNNVNKEVPNKTFGLLAYLNVGDAPSFKLAKNVVPFIPFERLQWIDGQSAQSDLMMLKDWKDVSQEVGWYDYIYGLNYLVPRPYFKTLDNYIKRGAANNVRHYYAEFYPNWIDGPKGWLLTKLLWDPNIPSENLLDTWYTKAFGTRSSKSMKAFYGVWENFWTVDVKKTAWWKKRKIWLAFSDTSYLKEIPQDNYARSLSYLNDALKNAENGQYKERIQYLKEMFDFQCLNYYYVNNISNPITKNKVNKNEIENSLQKLRRYEINDVFYRSYKKAIKY